MSLIRRSIMRMWLFVEHFRSIHAPFLSPSPPFVLLALSAISVSFPPTGLCFAAAAAAAAADSLLPLLSATVTARSLCLSSFSSLPRARSLFLARSPGPEACNERLRRQTRRLVSHRGER